MRRRADRIDHDGRRCRLRRASRGTLARRADKLAALEEQQNAWKVIVPFAVAARYAAAKSSAEAADKRLAELDTESARRGCARG